MNGIEKITQRLNEDAQAEINEILDAAKAEVRKITERYQSLAAREVEHQRAKNERAATEREERLVSTAQMEARKSILTAKQEMVERAYARALQKLCTLPEKECTEVLVSLLLQAAPKGMGEVILSEKDQKIGKAAVAKANQKSGGSLTVSKEMRPMQGGFVLQEGKVEINCAFETLVRLQREETAGIVAERLFG